MASLSSNSTGTDSSLKSKKKRSRRRSQNKSRSVSDNENDPILVATHVCSSSDLDKVRKLIDVDNANSSTARAIVKDDYQDQGELERLSEDLRDKRALSEAPNPEPVQLLSEVEETYHVSYMNQENQEEKIKIVICEPKELSEKHEEQNAGDHEKLEEITTNQIETDANGRNTGMRQENHEVEIQEIHEDQKEKEEPPYDEMEVSDQAVDNTETVASRQSDTMSRASESEKSQADDDSQHSRASKHSGKSSVSNQSNKSSLFSRSSHKSNKSQRSSKIFSPPPQSAISSDNVESLRRPSQLLDDVTEKAKELEYLASSIIDVEGLSERSETSVHSHKSGASVHSQKSGIVLSEKSGDSVHSPKSVASVQSPKSEASVHSRKSAADVHSPKSGASLHSPKSGTSAHSPKSGTSIHSPKSGSSVHSPTSGASLHSPKSGASVVLLKSKTSVHYDKSQTVIHLETSEAEKSEASITSPKSNKSMHSQKSAPSIHSEKSKASIHSEKSKVSIHSEKAQALVFSKNSQASTPSENLVPDQDRARASSSNHSMESHKSNASSAKSTSEKLSGKSKPSEKSKSDKSHKLKPSDERLNLEAEVIATPDELSTHTENSKSDVSRKSFSSKKLTLPPDPNSNDRAVEQVFTVSPNASKNSNSSSQKSASSKQSKISVTELYRDDLVSENLQSLSASEKASSRHSVESKKSSNNSAEIVCTKGSPEVTAVPSTSPLKITSEILLDNNGEPAEALPQMSEQKLLIDFNSPIPSQKNSLAKIHGSATDSQRSSQVKVLDGDRVAEMQVAEEPLETEDEVDEIEDMSVRSAITASSTVTINPPLAAGVIIAGNISEQHSDDRDEHLEAHGSKYVESKVRENVRKSFHDIRKSSTEVTGDENKDKGKDIPESDALADYASKRLHIDALNVINSNNLLDQFDKSEKDASETEASSTNFLLSSSSSDGSSGRSSQKSQQRISAYDAIPGEWRQSSSNEKISAPQSRDHHSSTSSGSSKKSGKSRKTEISKETVFPLVKIEFTHTPDEPPVSQTCLESLIEQEHCQYLDLDSDSAEVLPQSGTGALDLQPNEKTSSKSSRSSSSKTNSVNTKKKPRSNASEKSEKSDEASFRTVSSGINENPEQDDKESDMSKKTEDASLKSCHSETNQLAENAVCAEGKYSSIPPISALAEASINDPDESAILTGIIVGGPVLEPVLPEVHQDTDQPSVEDDKQLTSGTSETLDTEDDDDTEDEIEDMQDLEAETPVPQPSSMQDPHSDTEGNIPVTISGDPCNLGLAEVLDIDFKATEALEEILTDTRPLSQQSLGFNPTEISESLEKSTIELRLGSSDEVNRTMSTTAAHDLSFSPINLRVQPTIAIPKDPQNPYPADNPREGEEDADDSDIMKRWKTEDVLYETPDNNNNYLRSRESDGPNIAVPQVVISGTDENPEDGASYSEQSERLANQTLLLPPSRGPASSTHLFPSVPNPSVENCNEIDASHPCFRPNQRFDHERVARIALLKRDNPELVSFAQTAVQNVLLKAQNELQQRPEGTEDRSASKTSSKTRVVISAEMEEVNSSASVESRYFGTNLGNIGAEEAVENYQDSEPDESCLLDTADSDDPCPKEGEEGKLNESEYFPVPEQIPLRLSLCSHKSTTVNLSASHSEGSLDSSLTFHLPEVPNPSVANPDGLQNITPELNLANLSRWVGDICSTKEMLDASCDGKQSLELEPREGADKHSFLLRATLTPNSETCETSYDFPAIPDDELDVELAEDLSEEAIPESERREDTPNDRKFLELFDEETRCCDECKPENMSILGPPDWVINPKTIEDVITESDMTEEPGKTSFIQSIFNCFGKKHRSKSSKDRHCESLRHSPACDRGGASRFKSFSFSRRKK